MLNLSHDHMDRYATYDDYVNAKKQIFALQSATDYAFLNGDNRIIREMGKHLPSNVKYLSSREQKGDVYVKDIMVRVLDILHML